MNDRKQHVIRMAHQLFIDKGFQSTSIQDILEYSGISKGTFYNYFSSKNELLIALIKTLYKEMEQERNELLLGQDPSSIEIFARQIELQLKTNRANKLITLFEEIFVSHDKELKELIKQGHLRMLNWLHQRFIDIFGEDKKPYLLDCAVMFLGILNHNMKYYSIAYKSNEDIRRVVRYSVARLVKLVEEVTQEGESLFPPELLDAWIPSRKHQGQAFQQKLRQSILTLKKNLPASDEPHAHAQLLDFLQEELHARKPRKFLIESALLSLRTGQTALDTTELEELIASYFAHPEENQ